MTKKTYFWNCTNNPFNTLEELSEACESTNEITKEEFLKTCKIENHLYTNNIHKDLKYFPNDFSFYKFKEIYFYTHSCIEYFYK